MAEKRRILLLDDSPITLEMEKAVLEDRGYEAEIVRTFARAAEYALAAL